MTITYLENGDYRPEKVVEVFSVTDLLRPDLLRHDSSWSDDNWIGLAEFASKKVHSKNTKPMTTDIMYQICYFSHNSVGLYTVLQISTQKN